jgi:hypothetical protein
VVAVVFPRAVEVAAEDRLVDRDVALLVVRAADAGVAALDRDAVVKFKGQGTIAVAPPVVGVVRLVAGDPDDVTLRSVGERVLDLLVCGGPIQAIGIPIRRPTIDPKVLGARVVAERTEEEGGRCGHRQPEPDRRLFSRLHRVAPSLKVSRSDRAAGMAPESLLVVVYASSTGRAASSSWRPVR